MNTQRNSTPWLAVLALLLSGASLCAQDDASAPAAEPDVAIATAETEAPDLKEAIKQAYITEILDRSALAADAAIPFIIEEIATVVKESPPDERVAIELIGVPKTLGAKRALRRLRRGLDREKRVIHRGRRALHREKRLAHRARRNK